MKHISLQNPELETILGAATALESAAIDIGATSFKYESIALEDDNDKSVFARFVQWLKEMSIAFLKKIGDLLKKARAMFEKFLHGIDNKIDSLVSFFKSKIATQSWREEEFVKYVKSSLSNKEIGILKLFTRTGQTRDSQNEIINKLDNVVSVMANALVTIKNIDPAADDFVDVTIKLDNITGAVIDKPLYLSLISDNDSGSLDIVDIKSINIDALVKSVEVWEKRGLKAFENIERASKNFVNENNKIIERFQSEIKKDNTNVVTATIVEFLRGINKTIMESVVGGNVAIAVSYYGSLIKIVAVLHEATIKFAK